MTNSQKNEIEKRNFLEWFYNNYSGKPLELMLESWQASAHIKEHEMEQLVEGVKSTINDLLNRALSGSDKELRTDDGHIRWGLVEKMIYDTIDHNLSDIIETGELTF